MYLFTIRNRLLYCVTFKKLVIVILCSVILLFYEIFVYSATSSLDNNFRSDFINKIYTSNNKYIYNYYKSRQSWPTSNLGSILYKNTPSNEFSSHDRFNKTFHVLIWKYWDWLQARHVKGFSNSRNIDPFSQCSVRNCIISGNNSLLETADAVVVHLQRGLIPNSKNRKQGQRWIFLNDESPFNVFSMSSNRPKLSSLANIFNWSMTYRSDADVPVPYGRTVPISGPSERLVIPHWSNKQSDTLAAILISNCAVSYRMKYLNELKQYISVDVHGRCSDSNKTSCPGHFRSDCGLMSHYYFYLVFENSMCKEYLTEKAFYHAYSKGAIPVIMGPSLEDCKRLLPPNSYLHVEDFQSPSDLAKEMIKITDDLDRLLSFHEWREYFEVVNEHGYFGTKSLHFCRVCEALNYNDEREKVYSEDDLREFLDPSKTCR